MSPPLLDKTSATPDFIEKNSARRCLAGETTKWTTRPSFSRISARYNGIIVSVIDEQIPPPGSGDKLTREEFLRRWEAHPEIKRAELIGGIVYMPSPVSLEHGSIEWDVGLWRGTYDVATPGTDGGHNVTSFLLDDTPQPNIHLRILPDYGGGTSTRSSCRRAAKTA